MRKYPCQTSQQKQENKNKQNPNQKQGREKDQRVIGNKRKSYDEFIKIQIDVYIYRNLIYGKIQYKHMNVSDQKTVRIYQRIIIIYIRALMRMFQQKYAHCRRKQNYNLKADFEYLRDNNYIVTNEIDRGSYGVVYKAEDKNTGGYCAIKINFNIISRQQLYIEMSLLKLMRCKTRVPFLHRIIQKKGTYSIVMDYYKSKPFITFFNRFQIVQVKHYLYEMLLGLKQLKELGIYHRDLKPSNFLYDESVKRGVIVDFGLAEVDPEFTNKQRQKVKDLQQNESQDYEPEKQLLDIYENIGRCLNVIGRNKIGTQIFMPPESILRMQNQTYSSDIWPVGVIFLQFCSKRYNIFTNLTKLQQFFKLEKSFYISFLLQLGNLFGKQNVIDNCRDIFGYELKFPAMLKQIDLRSICIIDKFDDVAFDLLTRLLCLDPNKRISVDDALKHDFFTEIKHYHE